MRRVCFVLVSVAAIGLLPPAAHGDTPTTRVKQESFAYSPATVTVKAGTTVEWTYDEKPTDVGCESPVFRAVPPASCPGHSVTSVARTRNGTRLFDTGVHRASGFPFRYKFTKPGRYPYYCVVHGGPHPNNPVTHMNGVVVVTP